MGKEVIFSLEGRRALFLDLGGTLIQAQGSVGQVYAGRAQAQGIVLPVSAGELQERFVSSFRRRRQEARVRGDLAYGQSSSSARRFWRAVVGDVFAGFSLDPARMEGLFDDLYAFFARAKAWEIYPDVFPLLERSRQAGLKLALVSNWDARLEPLLDALELRSSFDVVVGSYKVGAEKPDRLIFERALALLGEEARPETILHIGDSYEEDFVGACQAGIGALHLDRLGQEPPQAKRITTLDVLS